MLSEEDVEAIREDFEFLTSNPNILGILAYELIDTNTIGICIVYPNCSDAEAKRLLENIHRKVDPAKYDVCIFEKSDLRTLREVLKESVVVWSRNEIQLEMYLEDYKRFIREEETIF